MCVLYLMMHYITLFCSFGLGMVGYLNSIGSLELSESSLGLYHTHGCDFIFLVLSYWHTANMKLSLIRQP